MFNGIAGFEIELAIKDARQNPHIAPSKLSELFVRACPRLLHTKNQFTSKWLLNGGRIYVEPANNQTHPEITTPECNSDPYELTSYYLAAQKIAKLTGAALEESFPGLKILIFANNEGTIKPSAPGAENPNQSFGFHENYMIKTDRVHEIIAWGELLLPHLITRQILTGAGVMRSFFEISQRVKHTNREFGSVSTEMKPIMNLKTEALSGYYENVPPEKRPQHTRLHVTSHDTPVMEYSVWLLSGIMMLILEAIERGFINKDKINRLMPTSPLSAMRIVSCDTACRNKFQVRSGMMSALDIQKNYLDLTSELLVSEESPKWVFKIWDEWKNLLSLFSETPIPLDALRTRVGWIHKFQLLERAAKKGGWFGKEVKTLNLFYHEIDRYTPDLILEYRSQSEKITTARNINQAVETPPLTRAANRVGITLGLESCPELIDWDKVDANEDHHYALSSPFFDPKLPYV